MTKDIVSKLRQHLSKPIDSECGVVYLMAELRKLLQRDDKDHKNGILWMYCHWALHVDLTNPGTTREFLTTVDRWVTNTVAYLEPTGPWKFMEEVYVFHDFLYLSTLRSELKKFLEQYDIPTTLCNNDGQWFRFIAEYGGVIEDGTLSMNADKSDEIGAVKKVTFKKGRVLTDENHVNFAIRWDIDLKDGRMLRGEFEALPKHPLKMSKHGLEIFNNGFIPPPLRVQPR